MSEEHRINTTATNERTPQITVPCIISNDQQTTFDG